jgi:hypothetical protein
LKLLFFVGRVAIPGHGNPLFTFYNSDNACIDPSLTLPYTVDQNNTTTDDFYGAGSKGIYDIFHAMANPPHIELYIDCEMAHGLDDCDQCQAGKTTDKITHECVPCFQSDFGTGATNTQDVQLYMVQRATTFFQTVITGQVSHLDRDIFYECVNNRVKSYTPSPPATHPWLPVATNNPVNCTQKCTIDNTLPQ